jgi:hypothetical protein
MKLITTFDILFIVALSYGCGPGENGDFLSAGNVVLNDTALEQQASPRSKCLSSRWLSQPNGTIEAKTLGELIKLCDEDKPPNKSDS